MKKKDLKELFADSATNLMGKIAVLEKEISMEILDLKMGKAKNVHGVKSKRRDVAQIKTVIKMKQFTESVKVLPKKGTKPKASEKVEVNINAAS